MTLKRRPLRDTHSALILDPFEAFRLEDRRLAGFRINQSQAGQLLRQYDDHTRTQPRLVQISLNDWLNTAAVCYQAVYEKEIEGMTPEQMYERLADRRHGYMLEYITDRDSKEAFRKWLESRVWQGAHPFEIVYSALDHGIHLLPPIEEPPERPHYILRVTDMNYAPHFIKMVNALIMRTNVSFVADDLEKIMAGLTS